MKGFTCIAHNNEFGLLKVGLDANYSQYELRKNASLIGVCEFPSHLAPKFSVSYDGVFAVYGGCNAYLIDQDQEMAHFEEQEEISQIWLLHSVLLVKGNTLLAVRSRHGLKNQKKYWHSEIITSGFMSTEDTFVFQDLENGAYQLTLDDFTVAPIDYSFVELR